MRYLAAELGPDGTRVNAISAGPLKTVSAQGVGEFQLMLDLYEGVSPMRKNISMDEVGNTGMFMLSGLSTGISAEVVHLDKGFSKMGAPPHDFINKLRSEG